MRLSGAASQRIVRWIESATADRLANRLGAGYQGDIYLYQTDEERYVIKAARGRGLFRVLRTRMLRNEFAAYQRLEGFAGSPRCYGLIDGKYLVLEYVDAVSVRVGQIVNPEIFFQSLFGFINEMHKRGVAHADLKRKENLLVVNGERPCIVDFGVAIVRTDGFAPFNHALFKLARQFDLNAWIKLKYRKRMSEISAEDRIYYHRTLIETALRETKRAYKRLKRKAFPAAKR
jgi:RIO-like serine/threonine protein kinase